MAEMIFYAGNLAQKLISDKMLIVSWILLAVDIMFFFCCCSFHSFHFGLFNFMCYFYFANYFTWTVTHKPHILFNFNFTLGTTKFATRDMAKTETKKPFFSLFVCVCAKNDAVIRHSTGNNTTLDQVKTKLMFKICNLISCSHNRRPEKWNLLN